MPGVGIQASGDESSLIWPDGAPGLVLLGCLLREVSLKYLKAYRPKNVPYMNTVDTSLPVFLKLSTNTTPQATFANMAAVSDNTNTFRGRNSNFCAVKDVWTVPKWWRFEMFWCDDGHRYYIVTRSMNVVLDPDSFMDSQTERVAADSGKSDTATVSCTCALFRAVNKTSRRDVNTWTSSLFSSGCIICALGLGI
jgi:hypothetical protein